MGAGLSCHAPAGRAAHLGSSAGPGRSQAAGLRRSGADTLGAPAVRRIRAAATAWRRSKSRSWPQSGQCRIISIIRDLLAARLSTMLARNPAAAVHLLRRVMMAFSAGNAAACRPGL